MITRLLIIWYISGTSQWLDTSHASHHLGIQSGQKHLCSKKTVWTAGFFFINSRNSCLNNRKQQWIWVDSTIRHGWCSAAIMFGLIESDGPRRSLLDFLNILWKLGTPKSPTQNFRTKPGGLRKQIVAAREKPKRIEPGFYPRCELSGEGRSNRNQLMLLMLFRGRYFFWIPNFHQQLNGTLPMDP